MTPLPYLTFIEFRGADAADFLHRQLSADILALNPGDSTFACLCQPKGRVIALLLLWRVDDGVRVVCATTLAEKVAAWLGRFVFRDDVEIEHRPGWTVLGGSAAEEGPACEPLPDLFYALSQDQAADPDAAAADAVRAGELMRGVAWLGEETSEAFLPQMLGAESAGALSYRKGCYPGQEIVARTHFLGRLKQRPLVAIMSEDPHLAPTERVIVRAGEQEAEATVVDCAPNAVGQFVALLVVRTPDAFGAETLHTGDGATPVEGNWLPVSQGSASR